MRCCLEKLVALGYPAADFEASLQELLAINAKSAKSQEALLRFTKDEKLVGKVLDEMIRPLPNDFLIPTTPNAKKILEDLGKQHRLALVTGGHPPFQLEKLRKAGIDRAIFSSISIPEDSIKKPYYQRLLQGMDPSEVLVCGDRIFMDLAPAHELGLTTVHMKWGRGLIGQGEPWIDHTIFDLEELKRIVNT